MVIAALAWSLKAWLALVQPRAADRQSLLTMEWKSFLQGVVLLPCQVGRAGRRLLYRLLHWNPRVDLLCRCVSGRRPRRFPSWRPTDVQVLTPQPLGTPPPRTATS